MKKNTPNATITATTVKIEKTLYQDFKILGIRTGTSLQDFMEKCVYLYVNKPEFQQTVNDFRIPRLSPLAYASSSF